MSRYRWSPAARLPLLSAFSADAGRARKVGLGHALVVAVLDEDEDEDVAVAVE